MAKSSSEDTGCVVVTVGHSTRTPETFIQVLQTYEVRQVVDVRTVPRSRHNPQFNHETLPDNLMAAGIEYLHMPGLGGLRPKNPSDPRLEHRGNDFGCRIRHPDKRIGRAEMARGCSRR